jgi:ribosomal protein S18 acetylase RimI-like enzyme
LSTALQPQILDLRHYSAQSLRPVLEEENRLWSERLTWDYRASTDLLLQYLDARVLPGFVAVENGRVIGYAFCVYEDRKAIIGDVFALSPQDTGRTTNSVETLLLQHLLELLKNSPGVERIESQLLLHTHNQHTTVFERAGFSVYRRIFMETDLTTLPGPNQRDPEAQSEAQSEAAILARHNLQLRSWHEADFTPAGTLIAHAYEGHLDSIINDQYRTVAGSLRFLHNIIRFPGCGLFDAPSSRVIEDRLTGSICGILLCSRVRQDVGHVTQACLAPSARGLGLGTFMLKSAMRELASRRFTKLSLTVTEGNTRAASLYRRLGFHDQHSFDAMVWTGPPTPPIPHLIR